MSQISWNPSLSWISSSVDPPFRPQSPFRWMKPQRSIEDLRVNHSLVDASLFHAVAQRKKMERKEKQRQRECIHTHASTLALSFQLSFHYWPAEAWLTFRPLTQGTLSISRLGQSSLYLCFFWGQARDDSCEWIPDPESDFCFYFFESKEDLESKRYYFLVLGP